MNRKIPRCSCSFECQIILENGDSYPAYLVDISANGGAICPVNPSDVEKFVVNTTSSIVMDLKSVIEIDSSFEAKVAIRWNKGTLVGAEIIEVDTGNFKKWLVLLCRSYFSA